MQVVLNVKNISKVIKPTKNDVILYDGKDWYVTTREKLFAEWNAMIQEHLDLLRNIQKENDDFKEEVAQQLKDMSDSILRVFEAKQEGENL